MDSNSPDECSGIEPFDPDDAVLLQVRIERLTRPEVAFVATEFLDDETSQLQPATFHILDVDSVVSDQRVRHRDDLAAVGRVGEDFLIAGHAGVKDDFAMNFTRGTKGSTFEDRTINQSKFRRTTHAYAP